MLEIYMKRVYQPVKCAREKKKEAQNEWRATKKKEIENEMILQKDEARWK